MELPWFGVSKLAMTDCYFEAKMTVVKGHATA